MADTSLARGGLGVALAMALGSLCAVSASAAPRSTLNLYGTTGLIELPSAAMQPDGQFAAVISRMGPVTRTVVSFQITSRLQGTFRYTGVKGLPLAGYTRDDTYYDRAFDLRFQMVEESKWWPALTIGLQDFMGTGLQSAEYIVASKSFGDQWRVTAGLGWGRLGSQGAIGQTGVRPTGQKTQTGGTANTDRWFRGDVAPFAGVEWSPSDELSFKVEYSSDAYVQESRYDVLTPSSQVNIGVEYQAQPGLRFGAYYLYGEEIGLTAKLSLNPKQRAIPGVSGPAPLPVKLRPAQSTNPGAWSQDWVNDGQTVTALRPQLAQRLRLEGVALDSLSVSATRAEVRVINLRYDAQAQMVGRVARALTSHLPASVEAFDIIPVVNGMGTAKVRINRSDLEQLEHANANAAALRARVTFAEGAQMAAGHMAGEPDQSRLQWSFGPYMRLGLFDPDNPVRGDVGVRLRANYELARGLYLSGSLQAPIVGNLDEASRASNSVLPRVRTEDYLRSKRDVQLENLTLAWYARPSDTLYSRVSAGYLERSFAGVSGEVLWKPVDSPLAFGVEMNYARQRAFDNYTGLTDYGIWTGHVSGYYAFGNGYHAQLDVGRYLAGDVGATLSLDREFANGWRVGAFATLTDVSYEDFGEGSFDKGLRLTMPVNWFLGVPNKNKLPATIRMLQRDGGARLNVDGRLYEAVRDYHVPRVDQQWGRVWR